MTKVTILFLVAAEVLGGVVGFLVGLEMGGYAGFIGATAAPIGAIVAGLATGSVARARTTQEEK